MNLARTGKNSSWRIPFGLAAMLIALSSCAKEADAPPAQVPAAVPSTADERPKVVILGDSLTAGLGLVETQSFPGLLQERADLNGFEVEIVNAGVSGDTSAGDCAVSIGRSRKTCASSWSHSGRTTVSAVFPSTR